MSGGFVESCHAPPLRKGECPLSLSIVRKPPFRFRPIPAIRTSVKISKLPR